MKKFTKKEKAFKRMMKNKNVIDNLCKIVVGVHTSVFHTHFFYFCEKALIYLQIHMNLIVNFCISWSNYF